MDTYYTWNHISLFVYFSSKRLITITRAKMKQSQKCTVDVAYISTTCIATKVCLSETHATWLLRGIVVIVKYRNSVSSHHDICADVTNILQIVINHSLSSSNGLMAPTAIFA